MGRVQPDGETLSRSDYPGDEFATAAAVARGDITVWCEDCAKPRFATTAIFREQFLRLAKECGIISPRGRHEGVGEWASRIGKQAFDIAWARGKPRWDSRFCSCRDWGGRLNWSGRRDAAWPGGVPQSG